MNLSSREAAEKPGPSPHQLNRTNKSPRPDDVATGTNCWGSLTRIDALPTITGC